MRVRGQPSPHAEVGLALPPAGMGYSGYGKVDPPAQGPTGCKWQRQDMSPAGWPVTSGLSWSLSSGASSHEPVYPLIYTHTTSSKTLLRAWYGLTAHLP